MHYYMGAFPESVDWTDWDARLDNLKGLGKDLVLHLTGFNNVADEDLSGIVRDLVGLEIAQMEYNDSVQETARVVARRADERRRLTLNPENLESCGLVPEQEQRIFGLNAFMDPTADPLSSMIHMSEARYTRFINQVGQGHNPVLTLKNPENGRVAHCRIGDYSEEIDDDTQLLVPMGVFMLLTGGAEEEGPIAVHASLCLRMFPFQRIAFTFLAPPTIRLKNVRNYVIKRIEKRMTNDRMPGISRGMEIPLWPHVKVRVDGIYGANRELYAAGFPLAGLEVHLLFDLKAE